MPAGGAAIGAGHAGPAGGTGGAGTKFAHSGGAGGASAGMTGSGPNSDGAWGASAGGGGAVASGVASDVAWGSAGGAGGIAPENACPQPMQNFCPAETSGLPQLGQNPNPVVISSLPLDSTWRQSDGGPSGLKAAPKGRTAIRSNQTTS